MKQKLKKTILKILLSDKEFIKLNAENPILTAGLIPITQTSDDDIFIVGYPKSGNTWMQNLIGSLIFGIDGTLLPDALTQELVPDVYVKKYYKRFHEISFFKSHELPKSYMKKVIYLVRDGRDVMASYYAMNKSLGRNASLEKMIIDGEDIFPSKWHIHVRAWMKNPFDAKILIVKFEDLRRNTVNELQRILDFVDIKRSNEIIERAVRGNSIREMKRKEKTYGWDNKDWNPEENFIRKGIVGSYKEELTKELINYFNKEAQKELEKFDYLRGK